MRRLLTLLGLVALAVVVVAGLLQAGGEEAPDTPPFVLGDAQRSLRGAPPQLAGLHAQAAELLDGGEEAFSRRLRALRGRPVVINKWASWCAPCRSEFPHFQAVSTRLGSEIAFLGLNSGDKPGPAGEFLERFPVPYPSYTDPDEEIARAYDAAKYYPMTIFVDERGEIVQVHPGEYDSPAELTADIDQYLPR
jgi:cytochrome c biogenesis protein CcmG/thiol:disulfide interchange protein DsbE